MTTPRIRAGELRQRIAIQSNTPVQNAYGQADGGSADAWNTIATRWAKIESSNGSAYTQNEQIMNLVSHVITCRYADLSAVTPRYRVLFGSRIFNVLAVLNSDERTIEMRMLVQEVV